MGFASPTLTGMTEAGLSFASRHQDLIKCEAVLVEEELAIVTNNSKERPIARILVIDDDADIVNSVKKGLLSNGFEAEGFSDPLLAMEHFRQNSGAYCAVLSDIRMPGYSGFSVAREIKRINPKVKVILLSSFEIMKDEVSKVMPSNQVDDFVSKPARVGQIKEVLLRHIGNTKMLKN
jgi:two-component system response regulator ChvI